MHTDIHETYTYHFCWKGYHVQILGSAIKETIGRICVKESQQLLNFYVPRVEPELQASPPLQKD